MKSRYQKFTWFTVIAVFLAATVGDWLGATSLSAVPAHSSGAGAACRPSDVATTSSPVISHLASFGNTAAPSSSSNTGVEGFQLLPGFKIERIHLVDKETQGSWVALTFDPQGRLIASDEGRKGLWRITPPPLSEAKRKLK